MIQALLDNGVPPEERDSNGRTAAEIAEEKGFAPLAYMLREAAADAAQWV